jgi:hemolysin (HlyC) family protein
MSEPGPSGGERDESGQGERSLYAWLKTVLGRAGGDRTPRQALQEMIASQPTGPDDEGLAPSERAMLSNLLRFGELRVDDVMVPRADVAAVERGTGFAELVKLFADVGHSRLPVFRETLDDVIGMVHVRDLLPLWGSEDGFALERVARRVLFVPPSMRVVDLLLQMRTTRIHMALVVDEYGGTDGLVTIEDLVEQIVGDIQDEHDTEEGPQIVEKPGGVIEADARTPVEELEKLLGLVLLDEDREEDIDTLSGLVSTLAGRVPSRGELIAHPAGIEFEVADADPRRVKRLRIRRTAPAAPAD